MEVPPVIPRPPFYRRHPRLSRWGLVLLGLVVAFAVVEGFLRYKGYHPGYLHMGVGPFRPLGDGEELALSHEFFTDGSGMFRAEADSFNGQPAYPGYWINRDGFRNPEWRELDSTRRRLLLIGDSFLWGATAKPIDSAFADHLARAGYTCINLGIPGADPDQYALAAARYLEPLRPDAVCVFFYAANDVILLPRQLKPGLNRYHITRNLGWLDAYLDHPEGMAEPQAAYNWYARRFSVPAGSWWNGFCRQTAAFTLLWQLQRHHFGKVAPAWDPTVADGVAQTIAAANSDSGAVSAGYLRDIQARCEAAGIPLHIFLIPVHTQLGQDFFAAQPRLREGLPWHVPTHLTREDYHDWPDGHFNNQGHRRYADWIRAELKQDGLPPGPRLPLPPAP
jgi:lysophospholipase L1-like esterase